MFGLGVWEFTLIVVVALLVLGPERLPKVARQLGRWARELRRFASDFQANLNIADDDPYRAPRPPTTTNDSKDRFQDAVPIGPPAQNAPRDDTPESQNAPPAELESEAGEKVDP